MQPELLNSVAPSPQIAIPLPAARRRDPQTSHDAAASMRGSQQGEAVLAALRELGRAGATAIATRAGLTQIQVCRRLPELAKAGLARTVAGLTRTAAGRAERIWEAA